MIEMIDVTIVALLCAALILIDFWEFQKRKKIELEYKSYKLKTFFCETNNETLRTQLEVAREIINEQKKTINELKK